MSRPAAGRPGVPRRWPPLLLGALGAGALAAVALRDPRVPSSWGACPVLAVTGLPCPFCGGLRATSDLLAGQPLEALAGNALAVALVVGGLAVWGAWLLAALRRRPLRLVDAVTDRRAVGAALVLAAFTLARWLPGAQAVLGP